MNQLQIQNKELKSQKAFTLVELIIVITILAVLATIAFLSFQSYTKDSRDASRAVNLSDITKALEIHKTTTSRFPTPDDISGTGQMLGVNLFQVGKVGTTNASLLKFDKTPVDPLTKTPYAYGLSLDNKYFQVAGTFENVNAGTHLVSSTYAATNNKAKVEGNYKGLLKFSTGSNQYIGNVPSLIFSTGGTYDLISGLDPYFVINNGKNLPYVVTSGDTTSNQVKAEIMQAVTGQPTVTLTGVIVSDWSTKADDIVAAIGYPKDLVGVEVLGTEYYRQPDGSLEFSGITFTQIDAGAYFTCGVTNTGKVMCWGENGASQTGIGGSTEPVLVPTEVTGLDGFIATQVSGGYYHACALSNAGKVKCWGSNERGQIGDSNHFNLYRNSGGNYRVFTAVNVDGLESDTITSISMGRYHSCALNTLGKVKCWGDNNYNLMGGWGEDPITGYRLYGPEADANYYFNNASGAVLIPFLSGSVATQLSSGDYENCVILNTGAIKCWGYNRFGAFGNNTKQGSYTGAATTLGLTGITINSISVGNYYMCGLTSTGSAKCWGEGMNEKIGDGGSVDRTLPVSVSGSLVFSKIYTGYDHTCGLLASGQAKCWGSNNGKYGNGVWQNSSIPVDAGGTGTYVDLALGYTHTCGITPSGTVKCWGMGSSGKLGNGETDMYYVPVDVIMPE